MHTNHHIAMRLANEHIRALRADASRGRRRRRLALARSPRGGARRQAAVPALRAGR
jgi:hypothetical protein